MDRLTMSKTRETPRLRCTLDLSVREVARALNPSVGVVAKTDKRARLRLRTRRPRSEAIELGRRLYLAA